MSDVGEFRHFMENRVLAPPVVLIVAGCIVFLVASLGCYGALRESYLMLMAVSIFVLTLNIFFKVIEKYWNAFESSFIILPELGLGC